MSEHVVSCDMNVPTPYVYTDSIPAGHPALRPVLLVVGDRRSSFGTHASACCPLSCIIIIIIIQLRGRQAEACDSILGKRRIAVRQDVAQNSKRVSEPQSSNPVTRPTHP